MSPETHAVPFDWKGELAAAQAWLGATISEFSRAEQSLGRLAQAIGLPTNKGNLSSLKQLRERLAVCGGACAGLDQRIEEWSARRQMRHLLAHATIRIAVDFKGRTITMTRICPLSTDDQTPDRNWTIDERSELEKFARSTAQSIEANVDNILSDQDIMKRLIPT